MPRIDARHGATQYQFWHLWRHGTVGSKKVFALSNKFWPNLQNTVEIQSEDSGSWVLQEPFIHVAYDSLWFLIRPTLSRTSQKKFDIIATAVGTGILCHYHQPQKTEVVENPLHLKGVSSFRLSRKEGCHDCVMKELIKLRRGNPTHSKLITRSLLSQSLRDTNPTRSPHFSLSQKTFHPFWHLDKPYFRK